ncbi:MAG TPA: DNA-binding domain-containing protein [Polyangiaceae bacterium]|nr:DNA-binding domain-containing protein [Polyangiaceae bacterium]
MSGPRKLGELQRWLFERVLDPAPADAETAAAVVVGGQLSAAERVEVYRQGYAARLVECLEDDYPALQHALGAAAFEAVCRDFIQAHPPPSPSLNHYGAPLARFLAARPEHWSQPAAELAQLEWALVEAIHAEEGERLDSVALGRLSPEDWSRARLLPSPALRLLRLRHAVADHYQAFREGSVASGRWPSPGESAIAVCRRGADIWRVRISPALAPLLACLISGTPLSSALERCTAGDETAGSAAIAPEELQRAFHDWVACGMFSGVRLE